MVVELFNLAITKQTGARARDLPAWEVSSAICFLPAQARDTRPHDRRGPSTAFTSTLSSPSAFHSLALVPPCAKSPAVALLRTRRPARGDGGRGEGGTLAISVLWGCFSPHISAAAAYISQGFRKVPASSPGCAPPPGTEPGCLVCMHAVPGMWVCFGGLGSGRRGALGGGGTHCAH